MKAMLLKKPAPAEDRPLERADVPVPEPAGDQILIRVSVCGACHTDLDEAEGRLATRLPVIPGHQVVGTVAGRGANAKKFEEGDRVGVTWLYSSCGRCKFCTRGNENLCDDALWTGKDADGGYAEYMVIGDKFAQPIPDRFTDSQAAPLLCAGVIGYRALSLADVTDGQVVGLIGFGASAHIVIQILKYKFPNSPVFVLTRGAEHREFARSLGADWTGEGTAEPPKKMDRAIDFTPVGEVIPPAMAHLDKGGRLVINAIRKVDAVPEMDYAEHLWLEKEIKSTANVSTQDAAEFLKLAAEIPILPNVEEFDLEQANEALLAIKNSTIRAAAVLKIAD
jgi:propanol-preferring alcohol dehydrogenase